MVPVQVLERVLGDAIDVSFAAIGDRGLKPILLNPEDDLCLADMERARPAFHRKPTTPHIAQSLFTIF